MQRTLRLSLTILATSAASLLAQTAPNPAAAPAPAVSPAPAPAPAAATDFKPIVDNIDLKDGDTVVFLGDSITHQCLYTQYIEDYFYTRYPKAHFHFHNAGVGGDRASHALARFDDDVAAFKPKYVTVLLGMNDGGYTRYDQAIFDTYQRDMNTVLDRIAAIGATAVPMTPTMHDARAARMSGHPQEPRDTYYNGVLALYGSWLREQAQVRGLGFVDMYAPLNDLTLEQRTKNPKWTMMKDAVHPEPTGQAVMAAAILNDMVAKSPVSQIVIQQKGGQPVATARSGKVTDLKTGTEGQLSFTFAAEALPWVLPPEAAEGFQLTHAGHKFSNEKLTVGGLKPGKYDLRIDGTSVGGYTEAQLATGVELEGNPKTPEYQQALKVALLNKRRNDEAMRPLRDRWADLKKRRRDLEKLQQANSPELDAKKAEFDQWYAAFQKSVAELVEKARGIEDEIYQSNKPAPHQYELAALQ